MDGSGQILAVSLLGAAALACAHNAVASWQSFPPRSKANITKQLEKKRLNQNPFKKRDSLCVAGTDYALIRPF